mmetsp:Transcript_5141/g.19251  ORF Transcript_5141/g.19251 Transcript_5141/m.19251 type:complete len:210 (-) Transcript_5141:596-1225(-)
MAPVLVSLRRPSTAGIGLNADEPCQQQDPRREQLRAERQCGAAETQAPAKAGSPGGVLADAARQHLLSHLLTAGVQFLPLEGQRKKVRARRVRGSTQRKQPDVSSDLELEVPRQRAQGWLNRLARGVEGEREVGLRAPRPVVRARVPGRTTHKVVGRKEQAVRRLPLAISGCNRCLRHGQRSIPGNSDSNLQAVLLGLPLRSEPKNIVV